MKGLKTNKGHRVKIDPKKRKDGTTALQIRYWSGSHWITETLGDRLTGNRENDKELLQVAEAIRARIESKLFLAGTEGASIFKGKTPFVKYFRTIMKDRNWKNCLTHLEKFPMKNRTLNSIDAQWIKEIQSFLLSKVHNPNSVHTYYAKVKACLNSAVREDIIRKSPASLVLPIKRVERDIECLTEEEIVKLSKTNTKFTETKRAFLFECYTGIRVSDLHRLTIGNIDLKENKIKFSITKTKKLLEIPLHPTAKELAFQNIGEGIIPMPNQYIFPDLKGYSTTNYEMRIWAKKAGITRPIHFHMGRASFATMLLKNGIRIEVVSKLLGHAQINVSLLHYAKILDEAKFKAISSLPDIQVGS